MTQFARSPVAPKADIAGDSSLVEGTAVWPVLVFLFLIAFVPVELGFSIGTLFFTWSKLYLLIFFPIIIFRLIKIKEPMHVFDWLFLCHVIWIAICTIKNYGIPRGIQNGGLYIVDFCTPYFLARAYLRDLKSFSIVVGFLFFAVCVAVIFAIPESLTGQRYVHNVAESITGNSYRFRSMQRLGLWRATSFFEHPILFGSFCASIFSLVWYLNSSIFSRVLKSSVIVIGTFLSLSSAPLLILFTQIGLVFSERVTRWMPNRLSLMFVSVMAVIVLLNTFTGRGAFGVMAMVTLNPSSAWYRTAIWENGIDDVMRNPIFGFQPETWTRLPWMSVSIDNHWLLLAMRGGFPAIIFLFLAIYFIWHNQTKNKEAIQIKQFNNIRLGWGGAILGILLCGATVAYFGKLLPLLSFFLGMGAALASISMSGISSHIQGQQSAESSSLGEKRSPVVSSARSKPKTTRYRYSRVAPRKINKEEIDD